MFEKILEQIDENTLTKESVYFLNAHGIKLVSASKMKEIVQEESKNGGWIPVGQRLPEEIIKDCLVTLENGAVFQAQYAKYHKEFRIVAPYHGIIRFHEDNPVIAWCELPAPYRKGEEN